MLRKGHSAPETGFMYFVDRGPSSQKGLQPAGPAPRALSPLEALLMSASCRVLSAGWFPREEGWYLYRRVIPHYIAFVCVRGVADFVIGGESCRLTPHSVLLMPPDVPQEGKHAPGEQPIEVYSLHFTARLHGVLDLPATLGLPPVMPLSDEVAGGVIAAAQRILDELAAREPGYVLAVDGECMRLLTALWRETLARTGDSSLRRAAHPAQIARLAPVFQLIQARYAEGLSLREMADALHLHPTYFSTLFKEITGWSPVQFLARYRLDRARELLASTDRPVHEIAAATGYGDPSHLRRELHRREGVSPRDYRESQKSPAWP